MNTNDFDEYYATKYWKIRKDIYNIQTESNDKNIITDAIINYIIQNSDSVFDLSQYLNNKL